MSLQREQPAREVFQFGLLLGIDYLVLFFRAILKPDLGAGSDMFDDIVDAIGSRPQPRGNLLVGRSLLVLFDSLTCESVVAPEQRFRRLRIELGLREGKPCHEHRHNGGGNPFAFHVNTP